jgi:hypothetical protein
MLLQVGGVLHLNLLSGIPSSIPSGIQLHPFDIHICIHLTSTSASIWHPSGIPSALAFHLAPIWHPSGIPSALAFHLAPIWHPSGIPSALASI